MSKVVMVGDLFIDEAVDFALTEVCLFLVSKIIEVTPRDLDRLPQNINRKDWKAPSRSSYFKPVQINWNWYEGVTGTLKRSVSHEKIENFYFLIGVLKWPATKYAMAQEFWTIHIPPRSFVRKWIFDNLEAAKELFARSIKLRLWL